MQEADAFTTEVEQGLGRPLTEDEAALVRDLRDDKTPELIVRELQGARIDDPKKIHPEHRDTRLEPGDTPT